jgi:2-dehydro-3-deoxygluconokinase
LGHRGAMLATPESRIHVRPPDVAALDTTGAGDVLSGAFLARVLAGDPPENALRYAVVAASLKTKGYGAVAPIPRQQEVIQTLGAQT